MKQSLIIALAMLLSVLCANAQEIDYENPQVFTIAGVTVEGAEFFDHNTLIAYTGLTVGEEISIPGPEIAKAIKKLWDQKLFSDVSVELDNVVGNKAFIVLKVQERPKISKFSFKGITKSQDEDLREKIMFVRGAIWTPEKERRASRIIKNYFIEKGFLHTAVNIVPEEDKVLKNGLWLKINVDKGKKIKINKIKIDGNQDFSDKRLVRTLKEYKEKRWWRIWSRSKYLPKKMDEVKTNLLAFYNTNGYRDARILSDSTYTYDEKSINLEFKVFEGNQYYIRNVDFVGNFKYSTDSLKAILGLQKGDIYNSEMIDQKLNGDPTGRDVSGLYLDDGYLFFNIQPVEVAVVNDSVDIEFRMFEGPQATIQNIILEGNTKTSDYVILRELRVLPGSKFSRSDLIRSQREILALGYFNQENMQVVPIPNPVDGTVDIKFVVEEKPSDQLQVQGGWGGRIFDANGEVIGGGFVGTVQLGFNNFSTKKFFTKNAWNPIPAGDGQRLNLAIQMNGVTWQNYSINFVEPWFGGKKPNSLGVGVAYSVNQSRTTDFRMSQFRTSVDFGKRLKIPDDFFRSYTTLAYKYYEIINGRRGFTSLSFDNAFVNIFSLKQTLDRTSIDAPIYPRSGAQVTFSVEATPPYSLFQPNKDYSAMDDAMKFNFLEYHKWSFSSTWYFQIVKNLVIKPRVQYGFLGSYNKDYGVSPFERYYLGGSGLGQWNIYGWEYVGLRGYPDNSIGPRPDGAPESTQPLGGNIYNKYTLELRYPITLNQAAPIWLVAFLEAGNSWLGVDNYNPFDLKRAAGGGLRVMLPMVGLLGVDWGYGFDRIAPTSTAANKGQFTFIIGQEF